VISILAPLPSHDWTCAEAALLQLRQKPVEIAELRPRQQRIDQCRRGRRFNLTERALEHSAEIEFVDQAHAGSRCL
jgi:hypothetical protein